MASWPARFLSNPLGSNSSLSTPVPATPLTTAFASPSAQRQTNTPPQDSAYPSVQLTPAVTPQRPQISPRQGSVHGRSKSHPFPSIFNSGRKVSRKGHDHDGFGPDSTDDEVIVTSGGSLSLATTKSDQGRSRRGGAERDLITGNCMTCDSLVRWPKELNVFRCTICLTINDLKPVKGNSRGEGHEAADTPPRLPGTPSTPNQQKRVAPISLEKTQTLIDNCLISYFETRHSLNGSHTVNLSGQQPGPRLTETVETEPVGFDGDGHHSKIQETLGTPPIYLISPRSEQEWPFPPNQPTSHLDSYARSSPGRIPSPLDQMSREEFPRSVPSAPTRRPPPPPTSVLESQLPPRQNVFDQSATGVVDDSRGSSGQKRTNEDAGERNDHDSQERANIVFKPLERYIISCFSSWECINSSFAITRPTLPGRATSEVMAKGWKSPGEGARHRAAPLSDLDAKTLLLGDFAENGSWWTGNQEKSRRPSGHPHRRDRSVDALSGNRNQIDVKSSWIDWPAVMRWYEIILGAGKDWRNKILEIQSGRTDATGTDGRGGMIAGEQNQSARDIQEIQTQIDDARWHVHRVLLKATENLLKRPGRSLKSPEDICFLLVILANPLLYPSYLSRPQAVAGPRERDASQSRRRLAVPQGGTPDKSRRPWETTGPGQHSGIIKRILGLLSNLPNESHHSLVSWFSNLPDLHFRRVVELVGSFVTYRLTRQHARKRSDGVDPTSGLVPNLTGSGAGSQAQLHAALGITGPSKAKDGKPKPVIYNDDWQIRAAARVMALLFSANNSNMHKRVTVPPTDTSDAANIGVAMAARNRANTHGQIIPTSDFYNTLLDYSDLVADFEAWESRRGKFSFCQYPFFLSIWAKIHIMEYDARRQMEVKAREAFFDSIMSRKAVSQYLVLKVRRDCLVEDSLRGVSEVVGSGQEDIKKGLRIEFLGEEGIDAGGLRKEWFLLLVRDVFDPDHGMFVYDEDSRHCYFNPNSFETSDQFFLVGVLLGLAIYNSTILDVALPPFAFKKLLASAPSSSGPTTYSSRPAPGYTLEDLAQLRPALANGLKQLIEFDGNVEETFCRDFVAEVDRYGQIVHVPLCPRGETRPVTNTNRREFVDLYIQYLLDISVARQYEPFKRGFYTVCGGNALSLFRPEEIELLVRGSDEPLDISSLRAVAIYENWGVANPGEAEPTIRWFWDFFRRVKPKDQRKILCFITGSDRIPAMGATSLIVKVSCLGDDCERFPVARTCFNAVCLWRYETREKLERKLWTAVTESEGFGLK